MGKVVSYLVCWLHVGNSEFWRKRVQARNGGNNENFTSFERLYMTRH